VVPEQRCVLLVEDDPDLRAFVAEVLTEAGYRVLAAADGLAALEQAAAQRPDLVLLDMRMPCMDGWEFARRFRTQHVGHVPIIVFTAATDATQRAGEIQADGYLAKPFELAELLAIVEHYLRSPA
jgi:CheY-like chemotaxis protein